MQKWILQITKKNAINVEKTPFVYASIRAYKGTVPSQQIWIHCTADWKED